MFRLKEIFDNNYKVVRANTKKLLEEVYKIRYLIYCVEHQYENPKNYPNGLEKDDFDNHSLHSLIQHKSGIYVATVRLVLPLLNSLDISTPVQVSCREPRITDPNLYPALETGEISRICISKNRKQLANIDKNIEKLIFPGLLQGCISMCNDNNITHWLGFMEPWFLDYLESMGVFFERVGPLIESHGMRQPVIQKLSKLLGNVPKELLEIITDDGKLKI